MGKCVRKAIDHSPSANDAPHGGWGGARWLPMVIGLLALAVVIRQLTGGVAMPPPSWLAGTAPVLFAAMIWMLESRALRSMRAHYPVRHRPIGHHLHRRSPTKP